MKKNYLLGLGALFVGLIWIFLMAHINNQVTTFDVHLAGKVDKLHFYQSLNPEKPIVTITTQGKDATAIVDLRNSVHKGGRFKEMYL